MNQLQHNELCQGFVGGQKSKREDDVQAARRLVKEQSGMSVLVEDLQAVGTVGNTRYFHLADTTPRHDIDSWPNLLDRTHYIRLYEWHTRIHDNTYSYTGKWRTQDQHALDILVQQIAPSTAKVNSISAHTLPRCVSMLQFKGKRCRNRTLFDSGASHSVMDIRTAQILGIEPDARRGPRNLIVADGKSAPILGMTSAIRIDLGGIVTTAEFIVADLGAAGAGQDDIILGIDWWGRYQFTFNYDDEGGIVGGAIAIRNAHGRVQQHQIPLGMRELSKPPEEDGLWRTRTKIKQISASTLRRSKAKYRELMTVLVAPATHSPHDLTEPGEGADMSEQVPMDIAGNPTTESDRDTQQQTAMDPRVADLIAAKGYSHIFNMPADHFPTNRDVMHKIELIREIPTDRRVPRMSQAEIEECRRQVSELLAKGWIEPSRSPIGAPIVFARKSDGSLRMCLDYRKLNSATRPDAVPLPRLENLLATLADARVFSSCDAKSWYNQILMHEPDIWKTAFKSPLGLFQWRVMPFGLTGSGGTANTMMEHVLRGLIHRPHSGVVVFVDDIAIYSRTEEEHLQVLEEVFDRFNRHGLFLNGKKCEFMKDRIHFLGHIISSEGLHPDPLKVSAVRDMPKPTTTKEVRRFIGMAGYYRRFIERFADICAPLHELVNNKWSAATHPTDWTKECDTAFETLKRKLIEAPVLRLVSLEQPLVLRTDASKIAMGATLYNDIDGVLHPVEYRSKKFSVPQQKKAPHEQEFLAVLYGLAEFRCYLLGRPFVLETDNSAVSWIKTSKDLCAQHSRWLDIFEEYQCTVRHRAGVRMHVEDTLSRIEWPESDPVHGNHPPFDPEKAFGRSLDAILQDSCYLKLLTIGGHIGDVAIPGTTSSPARVSLAVPQDSPAPAVEKRAPRRHASSTIDLSEIEFTDPSMREWPQLYKQDRELAEKFNEGKGQPDEEPAFVVHNGLMFLQEGTRHRLCVPPGQPREDMLLELHAAPMGGHVGLNKTLALAMDRLYWPKMHEDVSRFVQSCRICQEAKIDRRKKAGSYRPLAVPTLPFETIGIDFVGPFPKTQRGNDYICTVVCHLTGFTHLIPCRKDDSAADVARRFLREIVRLHGCPTKIVSDRDPKFTSKFWTDLCYRLGSKLKMSTAYHPQTDGRAERSNAFMTELLRTATTLNNSRAWEEALDMVEFAINSAPSKSTGLSPFYAVYGTNPKTPFDIMLSDVSPPPAEVPSVLEKVEVLKAVHTICADQVRRQRHLQTVYEQRRRRIETFEKGEEVLLSTRNLTLEVPKHAMKLVSPFIGPFMVTDTRSNSVVLDLPPAMKIHPTVNIANVRKYYQRQKPQRSRQPTPIAHDNAWAYEAEEILAERTNGSKREFLVRWKGYGKEEDSWEPASNFKNKNPAVIVLHRNRFPTAPQPEDGESDKPVAREAEQDSPDDELPALTPEDELAPQPLRRSIRRQKTRS